MAGTWNTSAVAETRPTMTEVAAECVAMIAAQARPWLPADRLPDGAEAALVEADMVEVWEHPNPAVGRVVALTPLAVERAGKAMIERRVERPTGLGFLSTRDRESDRVVLQYGPEFNLDAATWASWPDPKTVTRASDNAPEALLDDEGKPRKLLGATMTKDHALIAEAIRRKAAGEKPAGKAGRKATLKGGL